MSSMLKVSVILPFRNEEKTLQESVASLAKQDYAGSMEILAVNDRSTDDSLGILKTLMRKYANIRLIESEGNGEADARNAAVSEATGQVIVNFSAHSVAADNFLSVLVSKLSQSNEYVAGVGCRHVVPPAGRKMSRAFGAAMRSAFGGFETTYHQPETERFAGSVAFTAYRAEIFSHVGLFDPAMVNACDAEFNLRLKRAGYKLLYTPETHVYHYETSSVLAFFRKMVGYGAGRAKAMRRHPWSFRPIYSAPSIGLLVGALLCAGGALDVRPLFLLFGLILTYASCSLFSALKLASQEGLGQLMRLMIAFPLIHVGYGIGFIKGLIWLK